MIPVIAWGISFVNTKVLMDVMGPMTLGGTRFILAYALLIAFAKIMKIDTKIDKSDRKIFFLAGSIGITAYMYFENTGIDMIGASRASLLIAAIPVFTMIGEAIFYKRPFTKVDILSVILSIVGVVFIVGENPLILFQSSEITGYLLMFGAILAWVTYSMLSKKTFDKYNHFTILIHQTFYGAVCFLPFMFFEDFDMSVITGEHVLNIVLLVVFASVMGFYFYVKAMDTLGVSESGIFINFIPIVTIVVSYFYLGETINAMQWMGTALIIASVTLTSIESSKTRKPRID